MQSLESFENAQENVTVTFLMLPECLCWASRKKKPRKEFKQMEVQLSWLQNKKNFVLCTALQRKDASLSLKCHELTQARITWEAIRPCLLEISKTRPSKALYFNVSNIFTWGKKKQKPKVLQTDLCSQKSKTCSSEARGQEGGSQPPREAHLSC